MTSSLEAESFTIGIWLCSISSQSYSDLGSWETQGDQKLEKCFLWWDRLWLKLCFVVFIARQGECFCKHCPYILLPTEDQRKTGTNYKRHMKSCLQGQCLKLDIGVLRLLIIIMACSRVTQWKDIIISPLLETTYKILIWTQFKESWNLEKMGVLHEGIILLYFVLSSTLKSWPEEKWERG